MRHVAYDITTGVTAACWVVVGMLWVAGAIIGRRRGAPPRHREGRDRASSAGAAAGLLLATTPDTIWRPITDGSPWIRLAGAPVLVAATAGTVAARLALGSMWSSGAIAQQGHALRTDGPYRITRHPIYTGILGMLAGTALTQGLGQWAALLVVVALVLHAKIRAEERLLSREFPEEYARYRAQVPRLFPGWRRPRNPRRTAGGTPA